MEIRGFQDNCMKLNNINEKLSKDVLVDLYYTQKMSVEKITKVTKSSKPTVINQMKKFDILRRNRKEMTSGLNHWKFQPALDRICLHCLKSYRANTINDSNFCSLACYWQSMEKDFEPTHRRFLTTSKWKKFAAKVKNNRNLICNLCSLKNEECIELYGKSLHLHHIIPRDIRPDLALDENNLNLLCPTCHIKEHKQSNWFSR